MSKSLEGKVAVVTGASSGIGEAIAKVHISLRCGDFSTR
jgi:NADP-dependent 3-hydroxy acid dehydrogenase YdfG